MARNNGEVERAFGRLSAGLSNGIAASGLLCRFSSQTQTETVSRSGALRGFCFLDATIFPSSFQ